jgi:hypothetical protein
VGRPGLTLGSGLVLAPAHADSLCEDELTVLADNPFELLRTGATGFGSCPPGEALAVPTSIDPRKLAESAAHISGLRADIEARQATSRALDCPTCVRNEQVGFASARKEFRGSFIYTEVYDRYHWIVDLNPLTLFDGTVSTDGYAYTAWYGQDPFNMDNINMFSDMYYKYIKAGLSFWPPMPFVGGEIEGWGTTQDIDNAWQLTLTGSDEQHGHAITDVGHDASACRLYKGFTTCVRAEYQQSLDPTVRP